MFMTSDPGYLSELISDFTDLPVIKFVPQSRLPNLTIQAHTKVTAEKV
jgi:hypothetical protein